MTELTLRPLPHPNDEAVIASETAPTRLHEGYFLTLKSMHDILSAMIPVIERQTVTVSDVDPTTDDIEDGTYLVWNNTAAPYVRLYANIGGTLYKVALT